MTTKGESPPQFGKQAFSVQVTEYPTFSGNIEPGEVNCSFIQNTYLVFRSVCAFLRENVTFIERRARGKSSSDLKWVNM